MHILFSDPMHYALCMILMFIVGTMIILAMGWAWPDCPEGQPGLDLQGSGPG
jgi:hypothetical protein